MSRINELTAQVEALQNILASHGLVPPTPVEDRDRADYIEHGSAEHARLIGIIAVEDVEKASMDYTVFTSPRTGKAYRLEDEVSGFEKYPNPDKATRLILMQKVGSLETKPTVPANAPPLWQPRDMA